MCFPQGRAKAAVKDSSRIFSELVEFLERRRVEIKQLIRAQEKAEVTRAENHLQHVQRQISDLQRKDAELERLSHSQDQNLIIQVRREMLPSGCLCFFLSVLLHTERRLVSYAADMSVFWWSSCCRCRQLSDPQSTCLLWAREEGHLRPEGTAAESV